MDKPVKRFDVDLQKAENLRFKIHTLAHGEGVDVGTLICASIFSAVVAINTQVYDWPPGKLAELLVELNTHLVMRVMSDGPGGTVQ